MNPLDAIELKVATEIIPKTVRYPLGVPRIIDLTDLYGALEDDDESTAGHRGDAEDFAQNDQGEQVNDPTQGAGAKRGDGASTSPS